MKYTPFLTLAALGVCASAFATQPTDVVTSDSGANTAMGKNALLSLTSGNSNTAGGSATMQSTTSGNANTAFGALALNQNSDGTGNTAIGNYALYASTGNFNTAVGLTALESNTTGTYNVAIGQNAMGESSTGAGNFGVAIGAQALLSNEGDNNTAVGYLAMFHNTSGHDNVAIGEEALWNNSTGQQNMAVGRNALRNSTSGSFNAAMGYSSCWSCRNGGQNVAYGFKSLYNNTSGNTNIAMGYNSGYNITGSNNVAIANTGVAGESGVIRIGAASTQTKAFIAGILGNPMTGSTVVINSSGQLGVLSSSERYKTAIASMPSTADKLARLRPVTFHLKAEPDGALQYGLIAEEVDKVYPDLVIRDKEGKTQGVRYDELAPILLKEVQDQQSVIASQGKQLGEVTQQLAALKQQNDAMQAAVEKLLSSDQRLARR